MLMKSIINNNKAVIKFLAIFLISYATLYGLYYWLITSSDALDFFTKTVSKQTVYLLNFIDYETIAVTSEKKDYINLWVKGKNIVAIAEGCNAVSIMILFLAFIFSFSKGIKETALFAIVGIGLIHIMNIIRIIFLIICIYHLPAYATALHNYVFPAMIYGVVFLLWMYWVNSFQKSNHEQ